MGGLLFFTCLWLVGLQLFWQRALFLYAQSPAADLVLSIIASEEPVANAQTLSYTIVVQNIGPDDADAVVITDSLPVPYLRYSACTLSGNGSCQPAGDQVVAHFPVLAANATQTIQIEALSASVLLSGTQVSNEISVRSDTFDPNLQNNQTTLITTLWAPFDTTVSQSHSPEPILAGDVVAFTIQAKNLGPNPVYRTVDTVFENLSSLAISDSPTQSPTVATIYPSIINVANVVDPVINVVVTLHDLSHTQPGDLNILLVGPSGDSVTLMSDAGGNFALNDVNLRFTDNAPALPVSASIGSDLYRPTNYTDENGEVVDHYPTPGPGTLRDERPLLGRFNNKLANGAWKLYIVDDDSAHGGALLGGWSLTLTTERMTLPLTLTARLPQGFGVIQASTSGWGKNINNNQVIFTRQSFATNASSTFVITATVGANPGTYATDVFFDVPNDHNPLDNQSIATTTVLTNHDLSVGEIVAPNVVIAGEPLTYTMQITNSGPSEAWNPQIISLLPAELTITSIAASQGNCVQSNHELTCAPGLIASQVLENVVTIQVLAVASSQPIRVASSITVTTAYDPQPGNNSAVTFVDIITATPSPTDLATATMIPVQTATDTPTTVITPPPTHSPTSTETNTATSTATSTLTVTPTSTPTQPAPPTNQPTYTAIDTPTPTATTLVVNTQTPTSTATPTATATSTPTVTSSPTLSLTPSAAQETFYLPLIVR